jgi:hypothetical protein
MSGDLSRKNGTLWHLQMSNTTRRALKLLHSSSVAVQSLSCCTVPQLLYSPSVAVQSLSCWTVPQLLYSPSVAVQSLSCCTVPQLLHSPSVAVQSLKALAFHYKIVIPTGTAITYKTLIVTLVVRGKLCELWKCLRATAVHNLPFHSLTINAY